MNENIIKSMIYEDSMIYGSSIEPKIGFGIGTLTAVTEKIGEEDNKIYFGYTDSGEGIIVANGKLVSSKVLNIDYTNAIDTNSNDILTVSYIDTNNALVTTNIEIASMELIKTATDTVKNSITDNTNILSGNINALLSRLLVLEDKVSIMNKQNIEIIDLTTNTETLTDTTKDYMLSGEVNETLTVSGNSVTLNNVNVSNDARLKLSGNDVELKATTFNGAFPKSTSNTVISVNDTSDVIIKDITFNEDVTNYNAIEIGLTNNTELPSSILIENCKFNGVMSNNAISIFGTKDNAIININNCQFESVSNVIRLSNKTNASGIIVNITNCTVNNWETTTPWQGLLIMEDYTSKTIDETNENNLFGNGKITINITNLIGPNGKVVMPEDISTICGSMNENQIIYVCQDVNSPTYTIPYDTDKYPIININ